MEEQQLKQYPGFRFHPTEEELVGFYLRQRVEKKPFKISVIQELDLYAFEPWDLPGLSLIEGDRQWFFFVKPRGHNDGRPNRITAAGFWKATGSDRPVYTQSTLTPIGLKKTLVFYKGRALRGHKTDWIMNEYRLHPSVSENGGSVRLCRVYRKATSMKSFDCRATIQVEKRVNNCENTVLSSSVISMEQLQANSALSFADFKENKSTMKVETEVTEEDLRWLCWDGGSSIL